MATPSEKLAQSLERLKALQDAGVAAIRSRDLTRTHRERLVANGFLQEIIKGWYVAIGPQHSAGESTTWYSAYWGFVAAYLEARFGHEWALAPEQSLLLVVGDWTLPRQLLIRSSKGANKPTKLPHGTSMLDARLTLPAAGQSQVLKGLRIFSLAAALVRCGETFYRDRPIIARAALALIQEASELLSPLLEGGHSTVAGRLAGAMRNSGRGDIANEILASMRSAGYEVREHDPFLQVAAGTPALDRSPYVNRMRLTWDLMRAPIIEVFPGPPGLPSEPASYLKRVDEAYSNDAYHSLSIEGYQVTPELIERVRRGDWNPQDSTTDRQQRDAMAARGYHDAFWMVRENVARVLAGESPGKIAQEAHSAWYRALWAPSVQAGLARVTDLAGYRNAPVYIRNSMHVPPPHAAVRDLMPELFERLSEETEPAVRAVLGHYFLAFTHPYFDGNGRMARFMMNLMLASGGYPWTIIKVEHRTAYFAALDQAHISTDIRPFAAFLANLIGTAR